MRRGIGLGWAAGPSTFRAQAAARSLMAPRRRRAPVLARPAVAALALAVLASGCVTRTAPPVADLPDRVLAGWAQVCAEYEGWPDPCTVRATPEGPANENWLAVNPTDPDNVVVGAKDYNDTASSCVWGGRYVTFDGGRTWATHYFGGSRGDRDAPGHPLYGYQCMTDPMFAFDAEGLLYYVVEVYGRTPHEREGLLPVPPGSLGPFDRTLQHPDTGGGGIFIAVSRDGGASFGEPVPVWQGEGGLASLLDKTFILANPATGTIHFTTSQFVAGGQATQILVFHSRDQGASWDGPVVLGDPTQTGARFPAAFSAARDGTLYLTWVDAATGALQFTRSTDDGRTFEPPRAIATTAFAFEAPPNSEFRAVTQPYHAVDNSGGPRDGTIYLTWMDKADGHMDVRLMSSADGGASWTEPRVLTDDATDRAQFHPMPFVDERGAVHITYYDRRHDPADELVDLTWAIAEDGAEFTHRRITASGFDGDLGGHQDGFPFLGDYNGLGCVGGTCYASFADTRLGRSDVAVAKLVRT